MIKQALDLMNSLKNRPELVLTGAVDFYSVKTFLIGYVQGIGQALNLDLHKSISHWFQKKVNQNSSLFWSEHFTRYYENNSEEERLLLFIQSLEAFFSENDTLFARQD
jgi:hypothetical protein